MLLLFDKILPHWRKRIDQDASFPANSSMHYVWWYVISVAFFQSFDFIADGHFKGAAFHIAHLRVYVLVRRANSALFENDFDHHHVLVIRHDLSS